jgi:hypothetical protein
MPTSCSKCITLCDVKRFETIPQIFEKPKIIIDSQSQADSDLDATLLSNQNSSIPTDFSLDLMSFALRSYEIILNNSGDIFRAHLPLKEFVALLIGTTPEFFVFLRAHELGEGSPVILNFRNKARKKSQKSDWRW